MSMCVFALVCVQVCMCTYTCMYGCGLQIMGAIKRRLTPDHDQYEEDIQYYGFCRCVCLFVCVCLCACLCVCVRAHVCLCVCKCARECVFVCVCLCVYSLCMSARVCVIHPPCVHAYVRLRIYSFLCYTCRTYAYSCPYLRCVFASREIGACSDKTRSFDEYFSPVRDPNKNLDGPSDEL